MINERLKKRLKKDRPSTTITKHSSISTQRANWLMRSSDAALRRKCYKKPWQKLRTIHSYSRLEVKQL
jgi:hypothetical protein